MSPLPRADEVVVRNEVIRIRQNASNDNRSEKRNVSSAVVNSQLNNRSVIRERARIPLSCS